MMRLALFLILSALGILNAFAEQGEKFAEADSAVTESQENSEITVYDEAIDEPNERRRREAPKTENPNSQFIRSEKTTSRDNIIWRDNSETRKQGHVPTVTRVLYHGIYPSLNITEPLNVGKYRQKRAPPFGTQDTLEERPLLSTSSGTVSTNELGDMWQTSEQGTDEARSTNGSMVEETQQYTKSQTPTPYPTHTYQNRREPIGGNHYQRADHSQGSLKNAHLNLDPSVPKDYAQGSIRYRTMYVPSMSEYQGDPENKGRVKLISVGYYSINESTADLKSYRNPKVGQNHLSKHRAKRDTRWCWLDKFFKSIWVTRNPETREQENEIPGSEPLKLEVSEVNEEAQDVYGYSSNGHSHPHNVDRIYLVQNDKIQNPKQSQNPNPQEKMTNTPSASTNLPPMSAEQNPPANIPEEMPLPDRPVLIQAPPRKIVCRPPKRLARGRCRTVW